ncbi:VOC family protein [Maricaulis sp.]|uniref:VOC family protein n=1 Tax=Maricaulis sp. TaxID=1486257 RepID=UPI0025C2A4A4|nr:VOC family protein [Maricaulis sp.]
MTANLLGSAAILLTPGLASAVHWYRSAPGFACDFDPATNQAFAIAERDGAAIMLRQADTAPPPLRTHTPGLDLFDADVWVRDIAILAEDLAARATPLVEGPVKRIYGCTEIAVHDPDGHRIVFGYCP